MEEKSKDNISVFYQTGMFHDFGITYLLMTLDGVFLKLSKYR